MPPKRSGTDPIPSPDESKSHLIASYGVNTGASSPASRIHLYREMRPFPTTTASRWKSYRSERHQWKCRQPSRQSIDRSGAQPLGARYQVSFPVDVINAAGQRPIIFVSRAQGSSKDEGYLASDPGSEATYFASGVPQLRRALATITASPAPGEKAFRSLGTASSGKVKATLASNNRWYISPIKIRR